MNKIIPNMEPWDTQRAYDFRSCDVFALPKCLVRTKNRRPSRHQLFARCCALCCHTVTPFPDEKAEAQKTV